VRYSLIIRFHGLSLWMKRKTHFDVLFPRAEMVPPLEKHDVKWGVDPHATQPLADVVLDLTHLGIVPYGTPSLAVPGVLPVAVKGALAEQDDSAYEFKYCSAGMHLPYGFVSPLLEPFTGPFAYEGSENWYVSHGVEWRGLFDDADKVIGRTRTVPRGAFQDLPLGSVNVLTKSLELVVVCASASDESGTAPTIKYGDFIEDFDAYSWLLSPAGAASPAKLRSPQYYGGEIYSMRLYGVTKFGYSVRRPCPPVRQDTG
jgi:hypothetical protein